MSSSITPNVWTLAPIWFFTLGGIALVFVASAPKINLYQYYKSNDFEDDYYGYFYYSSESIAHAYLAWGIVLIVFGTITLFANTISLIFAVRRHAISSAFLLYSGVVLIIVWAILLICSFSVPPGDLGIFQLTGECLLIATSIAQTAYGTVLVRRLRRSGRGQGLGMGLGQVERRQEQAEKAAASVRDPVFDVPPQYREAYGIAR